MVAPDGMRVCRLQPGFGVVRCVDHAALRIDVVARLALQGVRQLDVSELQDGLHHHRDFGGAYAVPHHFHDRLADMQADTGPTSSPLRVLKHVDDARRGRAAG